ncbi:MAG: TIGR01212 family radical SAM protein [Clostridia bacterium]|nr:TIGR01212 family radical SAM protein [Clostridia bacterium]
MRRPTQSETNPFPFSDTNKRYHTFDYYLREKYGGKCAVIPLDAGFTCPNIDGTKGFGGCIYCSERGSGDFAPPPDLSLRDQYVLQTEKISEKWSCVGFIPYLQAHTNTYAPASTLAPLYALLPTLPGAVAVHVATRADCLSHEIAALLRTLSESTDLTVELGLQTVSDKTAKIINRCHTFDDFRAGFDLLRREAPRARICVHLIDGLPGESRPEMIASAKTVGQMGADEVKIHLLHVLSGTPLAAMFDRGEYVPMEMDEYVAVVAEQLTFLPPSCVIGRLTGDGVPDRLIAPDWSRKKLAVIDAIDNLLYQNDWTQGMRLT